ncbi:MAG: nitrate reductase [Candidatus Solibacter usitatus]|nr:nitrate reductase [Candidatus Solibacter usitatus]
MRGISRRKIFHLPVVTSAAALLGRADWTPLRGFVPAEPERWVKSVCRYCGAGCGVYIGVTGGKVTAVKGDAQNHNRGFVCVKGAKLPEIMTAPSRLKYPLVRKNGKLERASWEEAMALVAGKFRESIEKNGPDSVAFYGSGQGLTEETYAANKLFKAGIGTNNVDGNPRLCMASAAGGYTTSFGKDEPMGCYEDIDHADVLLIVGSNMAECHPILWMRVLDRKEKNPGTKIIVVDPRRTRTARMADMHLACKPGMDLTIMNAMAHVIVKEGLADEAFLKAHVTFGQGAEAGKTWEEYRKFIDAYTPERAARESGCRAEDIVQAALWFAARGRAAMTLWTMGVNQRVQGVWLNNLLMNLNLLTGKIGLPGSTPFSLTGQPNACGGVRDGGALAHLLPYGRLVANEAHRAEMEKLWGVPKGKLAAKPGYSAVELFQALDEGKVKCLYVMTTNPGQSLPNGNRYRKAMAREDTFLVVAEAFHPTRTSELADVVLPAALWAEKEGVYGCSERRYQLLEKAIEPAGEAKPDMEILLELAKRLGHGSLFQFKDAAGAWEELLALSQGTAYDFTGMTRDRLKQSHGLLWPLPAGAASGTRRRYVKGDDPLVPAAHPERVKFYGRPDGRAVVWMRDQKGPAEPPDAEYPFTLNTGRVLEHWHTGTMTGSVASLKATNYVAVAEMNPADLRRLGVKDGDQVLLKSRRGEQAFEVRETENGREGSVFVHMHDPNRLCNLLTVDAFDAASKEPEFKIAAVKVEKAAK